MKIKTSQVTKILLTEVKALDPITIICEDFGPRQGKINIECYGKSWSAYWGGMGDFTISEFFCSCDEHYIANNLSNIDSSIYDIDELTRQAKEKGITIYRDDPWNDFGFMDVMYGGDMSQWHSVLPEKPNPDYQYLCRIIKAVQEGLKQNMDKAV